MSSKIQSDLSKIIESTNIGEFLRVIDRHAKSGQQNLVKIPDSASLHNAIVKLSLNKVHSLIVFKPTENTTITSSKQPIAHDEQGHEIIGFIDMFDIVKFVLESGGASLTADKWHQVVSKSLVREAVNFSGRDPFRVFHKHDPLSFVVSRMSIGVHRVGVIAHNHELVAVISQSDVARFIGMFVEELPGKYKQASIAQCLSPRASVSGETKATTNNRKVHAVIAQSTTALEAFAKMIEKEISTIAVIDEKTQHFLTSLSISDFGYEPVQHTGDEATLVKQCFDRLNSCVLDYLAKEKSQMRRHTLKPCMIEESTTLECVIVKLALSQNYHAWIVDPKTNKVSALISLTDLLPLISFLPLHID